MTEPSVEDVTTMAAALSVVSRGLERVRRRNPDAGRLALLYAIQARQPARPSDLAAEEGMHLSQVTRQVQALEAAGYAVVAPAPDDGRSVLVTVTAAGEAELRRLHEIGVGRFRTFVTGWTAEEVRQLTRLLTKFEESRSRQAGEQGRAAKAVPPVRRRGRRTPGSRDQQQSARRDR